MTATPAITDEVAEARIELVAILPLAASAIGLPDVSFAAKVMATMSGYIEAGDDLEAGGILMGKYGDAGAIAVDDLTTPQPGDTREPARFVRGIEGHQHALALAMRVGQHFVGEWHTHPEDLVPRPSVADVNMWRRTVEHAVRFDPRRADVPLLFVVVGQTHVGIWRGTVG